MRLAGILHQPSVARSFRSWTGDVIRPATAACLCLVMTCGATTGLAQTNRQLAGLIFEAVPMSLAVDEDGNEILLPSPRTPPQPQLPPSVPASPDVMPFTGTADLYDTADLIGSASLAQETLLEANNMLSAEDEDIDSLSLIQQDRLADTQPTLLASTEDFSALALSDAAEVDIDITDAEFPMDDVDERLARDIEARLLQLEGSINQYEAAIQMLEEEGGVYEERLTQELISLGSLYRQAGDFATAIEILNRAWHITRVNFGLYSLDQAPVLEQLIETLLQDGDFGTVDTLQQYLFQLYQKSYSLNDMEILPAIESMARWQMFAYKNRLDLYNAGGTSSGALAAEASRLNRLLNVQYLYQMAIQLLLNTVSPSDPRLLDLEHKLASSNFMFANNNSQQYGSYAYVGSTPVTAGPAALAPPTMSMNNMGYKQGLEALERRLIYLQSMETPQIDKIADAMIDIGDWHLAFKKRSAAFSEYQQAITLLQEAGIGVESIDQLFSADVPVLIPVFAEHPYSRDAIGLDEKFALDYQGYFDVSVIINRYGTVDSLKVLGKSNETSDVVESRLIRHLRRANFRPPVHDGQADDKHVYHLRYYYSYPSLG